MVDSNGFGPVAYVDAPPASVPRISLLSAARVLQGPDAGDRWENGFAFLPENCTGVGVADPCESDTRETHAAPDIVKYQPFEVFAGDKCTTLQWATHDFQARAQRLLLAAQSKAIEAEFWTGTLAASESWPNRYLTDGSAVSMTTGANDPEDALACLEQGLADCNNGQRGMIHATKTVVTAWDSLHLLRREGNAILTVNDTIVVAGSGYDGSSHAGAATSGHVWAYATSGMVDVRLGAIYLTPDPADADSFAQATDRSVNLVNWRASRGAAVTWDGCCLLAAEVNVDLCPPGGS